MTSLRTRAFLACAGFLLVAACAPRPQRSELEWQRGQCAQINDKEARERCLERVDRQ